MSIWSVIKTVFRAYFVAELLRSRGFVYGLLSFAIWITLFIMPIALFAPHAVSPGQVSAVALTAVAIFLAYSVATWDWAWLLRWLTHQGMLEYIIASGRSIYVLYAGVIPVSAIWYLAALVVTYIMLSLLVAPPSFSVEVPWALVLGFGLLFTVMLGYAMLLGGTVIATGTSGPIVEFIGWILPIATGGLTPLRNLPTEVQLVALATPFSYPAELIRYGLGISMPVMDPREAALRGAIYATVFLALSIAFMEYQLRKLLREGIKSAAMF